MSNNTDEKYTGGGDSDSQVRSIIKQLHEDNPSHEKSREVVVRSDGTKVVRVVKKRKVMITNEEKGRRLRRSFLSGFLLVILLLVGFAAYLSYRMSVMSGGQYLAEKEDELCLAWGAERVRCTEPSISGLDLTIGSIVVEFPEKSILERVELRKISCKLGFDTFFLGVLKSDEVKVEQASIRLRRDAKVLDIPHWQGDVLWEFKRVACDSLDFTFGELGGSPVVLSGSDAYMYFPSAASDSRVVILKGGLLKMRGWKPLSLIDAKLQVSSDAIEDIRLTGTFDSEHEGKDTPATVVSIMGRIAGGDPLSGPLMLDANNISFSDFSQGRFNQFFSATVVSSAQGTTKTTAHITLPLENMHPVFNGSFRLKDISITSLPALLEITEHIEPIKRKGYRPPKILKGRVELLTRNDTVELVIPEDEMKQPDLLSVNGSFAVDGSNSLSGTMNYGIPAFLTHVEYSDGVSDPVFQDDGAFAWLRTEVSGQANAPTDNSHELDQRAEQARRTRPSRTPFDQLDVEMFSRQIQNNRDDVGADALPSRTQGEGNSGSSFEDTQSPLEEGRESSSSDSGGGLTLPVDSSWFSAS